MMRAKRSGVRRNARGAPAAVFQTDGVRGEDNEAAPRQFRGKGLQRVAGQPHHLALAQVPLARMLVVDEHGRKRPRTLGQEQEGGDGVAVNGRVADALARVTIQCL